MTGAADRAPYGLDPSTWVAVTRDDREVVGYLQPTAPDFAAVIPRNRLGHAVGGPQEYVEAEELLIDRGIGELAEHWRLDGGGQALAISELSANGIVLRDALLSKALVHGEAVIVDWPDLAGRLTR
ncbi:hypothetical protein [Agromyces aerolatus]|uniref:hypothetical protein n=1 Tax=Agromyces sp. LY-1074 TaxID=3074080 RepID=UPI0028642142|nr:MULTISPECIES: hypothetical protein [unclassified Agromyces]MDR5698666.1 hypothetical protein [Agromyces sp. LY-1074]MDR5704960.1 hypothetical protein [Agromyces sp. LY-1358]